MKRLILTSSSGSCLLRSGLAEVVIPLWFRFVWGPLPPSEEFEAYLGVRSDQAPGCHWSDWNLGRWSREAKARRHLAFVEFCEPYETVELWFDPKPNDQLQLIWLLDYFRSRPEIAAKLRLRLVDFNLMMADVEAPDLSRVPVFDVVTAEFETASMNWQAYRAPTPEACFALFHSDLSALPLLRPALADLLEELPSSATGLGATEMRLLELIAAGYEDTNALFHLRTLRQRLVFDSWETGSLLEGLAHGSRPAVAGLDDELRVIRRENLRDRLEAYQRSRLSLTEFGKAIVTYKEDFSRHNPIDRWWGGTRLTNDRLWRWNTALMKPQGVP